MSAPSLHSSDPEQEKAADVHREYGKNLNATALDAPGLTAEEQKKLLRRVDYKLVPFLSLLYLLSFLDRVNIGQARLDGLEADLGLKGNQYQVALLVFFVGYVITEIPSNVLLKRIKPSRFIPGVMILWGIIMTLMGIVHNFAGLAAARFFLGLAESPLFPGFSWYRRDESQLRIFSSATLSGAFGGILAFGISKMGGVGGKPGWAWIFILEGLATFVVGVWAIFMIQDFPEDAKFLNEHERAFIVNRLKEDTGAAGGFRWVHIKGAFLDWRAYVCKFFALIYIGVAEPLYSLSLFTPTIIAELGTWTRPQAQLLSVPPYALAFIITLANALLSDKFKQRGLVNIFWMTIVVIGFAIQLGINPVEQPGVAYFAIFLCVCGVAPCIANTITWCGNNSAPVLRRGTAMGMLFMTGNSGGIVSSVVYRTQDKPTYAIGHGVGLGFAAMAVVLSAFMTIYYRRENARRDALYGKIDASLTSANGETLANIMDNPEALRRYGLEGMSEEELEALGDRSPLFRYYP
ncbi:hypothetical protein JCM10207_001681 [Rhodosporidiobolus poonsookiae]